MKRGWLIGGAALALSSTLVTAQQRPESLLPPGFDDPAPAPTATAAPRPQPQPAQPGSVTAQPAPGTPVIQPLPGGTAPPPVSIPSSAIPGNLPSLDELEKLDNDKLDELLGLKPKFDMPVAARRSMERVGVLDMSEGGLPTASLANQPASIVRAALAGTKRPLVSRWGHILLRRALASRLEAPAGMDPAEFAALRVATLNAMGEWGVARALAQDVDTGNWNGPLTDAAFDAYLHSTDIVGICPRVQVGSHAREDAQWEMVRSICAAFAGQGARAGSDLSRMLSRGAAEPIDVLLAQRYAGAAGAGRRAVNLEWDNVERLTPWRFALASAVGASIPEPLLANPSPVLQRMAATSPMLPLAQRAGAADRAAREGILSSAAYVDLLAQLRARGETGGDSARIAARLRDAYVLADPAQRVAAIKDVWGGAEPDYGRQVLTAYATARLEPSEDLRDDAAMLIVSMLSAGFERDALRWASILPQGSEGWALLVFAQPNRNTPVSSGQFDAFRGNDDSVGQRKSAFLLAGLAGLGRIEPGAVAGLAADLGTDFERSTRWSTLIDQAADVGNPALVAFLAGVGMQGSSWDRMTPRHLYQIVSALNRVGLSAEARMIAAEAVARG
ncbi:MAG: hypothetical protein ACK4GD_11960 [Sphingomonadaceae bacterium]